MTQHDRPLTPAELDAMSDAVDAAKLAREAQPAATVLDELAEVYAEQGHPDRLARQFAAALLAAHTRELAALVAEHARQRGQEMRARGDRSRVATCGGMQAARRVLTDRAAELDPEEAQR